MKKTKSQKMVYGKFGRLTIIGVYRSSGRTYAKCLCDCGVFKDIRVDAIVSGAVLSCGCLNSERSKKRATTHGMSKTRAYTTWQSMHCRCSHENSPSYKKYGAVGIRVCRRWNLFENFFEDMGERPEGTSIDRINGEKGYFKKNCRWATDEVQSRNSKIFNTNTTGIKGVSFNKQKKKYRAYINSLNKQIHLGYFSEIKNAVKSRVAAEDRMWGADR